MRLAVVFFGILLFSSYFLIAQVKEDIIKKHLQAIGGEKNWQNIKTISISGIRESEGLEIEETKQIVPGKAIRIDYKFKSRDAETSKKNYFVIINDNKGWKYLPDNMKDTIEVLQSDEVKFYQSECFSFDPFLNIGNADVKVEYMNKEVVAETDCFKFAVNYASGKTETIYIDSKNYLIVKRISIANESEVELEYSDYKKVDNKLNVAYKVSSAVDTYLLKSVSVNIPLNDQLFKPVMKLSY